MESWLLIRFTARRVVSKASLMVRLEAVHPSYSNDTMYTHISSPFSFHFLTRNKVDAFKLLCAAIREFNMILEHQYSAFW
jgi:hypothetical protein